MLSADELATLHDGINQMLETVDAFRASCLQRGYSPTASEAMAMEFWAMLCRQTATA